jgi:hypothetical protein
MYEAVPDQTRVCCGLFATAAVTEGQGRSGARLPLSTAARRQGNKRAVTTVLARGAGSIGDRLTSLLGKGPS